MESRIFYPIKPVFTYKEHKQICFHAWTEAVLSNELLESKFWTIKMMTGINISVSSTYLLTELKYKQRAPHKANTLSTETMGTERAPANLLFPVTVVAASKYRLNIPYSK